MTLSMRKVSAIFMMKLQTILKNPSILLGPVMAIAFVLIFKYVMPKEVLESPDGSYLLTYFLTLGVLFNIMMTGIMASALPLAEEKEKNTLRVLMTSSVNKAEFFIGSLVPVLIVMIIVNLIILPISGVDIINIPVYILVTTVGSIITVILGFIIGLVSKNQMSTSLTATPFMLVFLLFPMFSTFNEGLATVSKFIYTGALNNILQKLAAQDPYPVTIENIIVIIAWLVISILLFIVAYRKNGIDK